MAGARERRVHIGPEPQPHELSHRPHAQRRQRHDLRRQIPGERGQHGRNLGRLGRPRRRDNRDRQLLEPSPKVVQKAQRRLVSPVRVVDAEQQRRAPPQVRAQPVEPVQDPERRVRRLVGERTLGCRDAEQRRCPPGGAREQLRSLRRRRRDYRGLEQLARETVGELPLQFRPPRAFCVVRPSSRPRCAAARISRVLPIPAGPSSSRSEPRPAMASRNR